MNTEMPIPRNAEIATRCLRKYSEDVHNWTESESVAENAKTLNELLEILCTTLL